jgi:hypothetical protein
VFSLVWNDEVRHRLLAKGALLIKDAQSLDHIEYSTFIYFLIVNIRRIFQKKSRRSKAKTNLKGGCYIQL